MAGRAKPALAVVGGLSLGRRREIIRAAAKLFALRGFSRTRMDDIASAIGISKPILYNHFGSKNEVLLECYRYGCEVTLEGLDRAEPRCQTGLDRIRAFVDVYVNAIVGEVGTCLVLLDDRDLEDSERALGRSYRQKVEARLRLYIEQGIADGTLAPCDPALTTLVIAGAMNSMGYWYSPSGRLSLEEIVTRLNDLFVRALGTADAGRQA